MTKRSKHTRATIQSAFLTLLDEKPYEAISINDIARVGGCTRVTVHRHFGTKENLMLDCLELFLETIKGQLIYPRDAPHKGPSQIAFLNLVWLYTHVADNRAFYRALFASSVGHQVRSRVRRLTAGVTLQIWFQEDGMHLLQPAPPVMVANLIADLVLGAMIWWLESESTEPPALMAEIVLRLIETGVFGLRGQTPGEADISFTPFTFPPSTALLQNSAGKQ